MAPAQTFELFAFLEVYISVIGHTGLIITLSIKDTNVNVRSVLGISWDITDRKNTADELHESE
jgi:hypothetical protein